MRVSVEIREVTEEELRGIKNAFLSSHYRQPGLGDSKSFRLLAQDESGQELAFAVVDKLPQGGGFNITSLFVVSEHRKTGVGSRLLDRIEAFARENGRGAVFVEPAPHDSSQRESVITYLEHRGYSCVDSAGNLMKKDLDEGV